MTTKDPKKTLTTTAGIPVGDNQNSLTAGARGGSHAGLPPVEKMAHSIRTIPERVVVPRGWRFRHVHRDERHHAFTKAHLFPKSAAPGAGPVLGQR